MINIILNLLRDFVLSFIGLLFIYCYFDCYFFYHYSNYYVNFIISNVIFVIVIVIFVNFNSIILLRYFYISIMIHINCYLFIIFKEVIFFVKLTHRYYKQFPIFSMFILLFYSYFDLSIY